MWTKNSWRLLAMGSQRAVTIAVSVTISTSVQNRHSRILLRALVRSRMSEMRREPEVPEARVPVEESFDCHAIITSKELAPIHSVKSGILQDACSTSPRLDADFGTSGLMRITRLMSVGSRRVVWDFTKCVYKIRGNQEQGLVLLVFGCVVSSSAILNKTRGSRNCCRLWSKTDLKFGRTGNRSSIQKPWHRCNSQWGSANERGSYSLRRGIGFTCDSTGPRGHAASSNAWKALRQSWTSGQNSHHIQACRKYGATRKTTFPSLWWVCQLGLPPVGRKVRPQHLCRRTQCDILLREGQQIQEAGVNAVRLRESWSETQTKPGKEIKRRPTIRHKKTCCETCADGWRIPQSKNHKRGVLTSRFIPNLRQKVVSGKQSTFTHFPNDRNCEVCRKDQNHEVSFQKTNWGNSTSSGKVGHLIAADHKFSTRKVNRGTITEYAVVVQELSSQLLQSYPSKTIFSGNRKELAKVQPDRKRKVIYADNSLKFGKVCEVLSWNHCTSTPLRSEQMVLKSW